MTCIKYVRQSILCILICSSTISYSQIVINEIHFDPDVKTQWVEFVELYNAGTDTVDLSGWYLQNAIEFTFPEATTIAPNQYLVIAQRVNDVVTKYSVASNLVLGPFVGQLSNEGEHIELCRANGQVEDEVEYGMGFPWPTVGNPVPENQAGTSYSIQLVNPAFDNDLAGCWRSASPTPGKINSVHAANIPPQVRQVSHTPNEPVSNQIVTITAKVTDADGIANVTLHYQIVDPGKYIALDDAKYQTEWTSIAMHDDGKEGDEIAGDFMFAVQMPATFQVHRRLIRYIITVTDSQGNTLNVPYADDPQPNFAYFCYDSVPAWTGSIRPGQVAEVTYSKALMNSLPVYHLISTKEEVEKCTWYDQDWSSEYRYIGTLIYDGVVYDHIHFRARGGVWRYSMGKNMWKFNMNRGHGFQARDNFGRKYKTKWDKVNLGANIQQGDYLHRGEQGLFESVGFKLFNMAGIESSKTNFVHFRIIDEENEDGKLNAAHTSLTTSGTQYDGDFWGLYLAVEQVDGHFLDEHGLPDGNLYKMESGTGELKNQSPMGVSNGSDLRSFMSSYQSRPNGDWWRSNIDIDRYFNYRTMVEGIHQYDIASGKNYYYYMNPETKQWYQIPWDLDLTWADNMYGQGSDPFMQAGILQNSDVRLDYQNRMREIRDLLYNTDQTNQLIDEFASFIYNSKGESFVDADRAMWDYHWVMSNQAAQYGMNNPSKSGQGRFYQIVSSKDFAGMVKLMKDYVESRSSWIDEEILDYDQNVPKTPVIQSVSPKYPVDSLVFETNSFNDTTGASFAAMKWRIAEVEPTSTPEIPSVDPGNGTTLLPEKTTWKYFKGTREPSEPRSAYRQIDFDDSTWNEGIAPIGYGEDFIKTNLTDMLGKYTTIYLRKTFEVGDLTKIKRLVANVLFDDGFNMWINGVLVNQDYVTSDELAYDAVAIHREDLTYVKYELADPSTYLVQGTNIIAIQVVNQYLSQSTDCFIDVSLVSYEEAESTDPEPEEPEEPTQHSTESLKYEIDAIWESEELTQFQSQITIPSDKVVKGRTYRVRVKMKNSNGVWSHWSTPVQFVTEESDARALVFDHLRVTEAMYNPVGGSAYEFIELHNTSSSASLTLDGYAFTEGITFTFPAGTVLSPDGYLLVVPSTSEEEKVAFRQYYGIDNSVPLFGPFSGKLSNEGEKVTFKTSEVGESMFSFAFNNGRGWNISPDGTGHSLVPIASAIDTEDTGSLDYGGNWRASSYIGGSPGKADPEPIAGIIINELMANSSDGNDWVEFYNSSSSTLHLGDFYLSDDETDLKKWAFPSIEIAAGTFLEVDAKTGFNVNGNGFGLGKNGEQVFLSYLPGQAGVDRVVDSVSFKAQEKNHSWGRWSEGSVYWIAMTPSSQQSNQPDRLPLVIDELMYHPQDEGSQNTDDSSWGEYIELYNPTEQVVQLWNENGPWRIDGGVEWMFAPETAIAAEGRLLIVPFDPQNTADLDAFLSLYPLNPNEVQIVGPYSGVLSNRGERIAIEKLLEVDSTDGSLAWAIVDEVIYFDQSPWISEADGTGKSLQRVASQQSGNDPLNWKAGIATPGREGQIDTPISAWMLY